MKNRATKIVQLIWGAVIVAVIASTVTLLITGSRGQHWVTDAEYERIERYARLDEVRDILLKEYYQPLEEDALITGAIRGMTGAVGDIYTFYYTPEEMKREQEDSAGHYQGIGVQVQRTQDGHIQIIRVYQDTPSQAAGLMPGDLIVSVDGHPVSAATVADYTESVRRIRGEEFTEVSLGIDRDGERLEVSVARQAVTISYVTDAVLEGDIGYIAVDQFTGDAADRFLEVIDDFKARNLKGLIVDVRNNPGGYLNLVNRMADALLPEGIIVYVQDGQGKRTDYYSDEEYWDVPLAVLTNGMSASASEILAASVQALGRGVVVGETTYGKGVVQTMTTFPEDGAGMQYTTASYFDANGRSINGVGVEPDVQVALTADSVPIIPDPQADNQLSAAMKEVREAIKNGNGSTPLPSASSY